MNRKDAVAALADVRETQAKLAGRARWPFHRHAMFGMAEGLIVAGLAQPNSLAVAMIVIAMVLLIVCVAADRRRDGMFVSGWQPGATRPLTIGITLFVLAMAAASAMYRDVEHAGVLGYVFGALTAVVCTGASLRWEKIYRNDLLGKSEE